MTSFLNEEQTRHFQQRLRMLREDVLDAIRDELLDAEDERYAELAGRVHDVADEATADLLIDLELAEVDRLVHELRDVATAEERLAEGAYGQCVRCGGDIDLRRLEANPTAMRCQRCQRIHEKTETAEATPRM